MRERGVDEGGLKMGVLDQGIISNIEDTVSRLSAKQITNDENSKEKINEILNKSVDIKKIVECLSKGIINAKILLN